MKRILFLTMAVWLLCSGTAWAQEKMAVQVSVTDTKGEALPGATVVEMGTRNTATTDINGKTTITVPVNATLEVSFMGYTSRQVTATRAIIDVQLEEGGVLLDEVVMIGYGTQTKANLTSAVGTASGKVLENRPITTIGEGLQGVIPNLQVTPSGTAPGQGASFNIRGYTSLNGGGPLILVDGVVQDPNLVNPNDIESVSVLKDAASAAIYGARAAYGVILFTTKSGKKNQKPTFNVSTSWAVSSPIHLQHSMNSLDYVNFMNLAAKNNNTSAVFTERQVDFIKAYLADPTPEKSVYFPADGRDANPNKYGYSGNTDWADELYKSGGQQQYNVSMSGGSENTQYFVSYGFLKQDGILAVYDDSYQRHTINMDLSTDIKKWLTFGAKAKYTYGYEDHPSGGMSNSGLGAYSGVLKSDLPPFMPVTHPDGSFAGQGNFTNPAAIGALAGYDQRKVNDLWVTGKLTIRPLAGWNINADFTFNPYSWNQERVIKQFMEKLGNGSETPYPWVADHGITRANANDYYTALNVYSDYTTNINKHNFKLTVGYNQEIKTNKSFNAARLGLIDKDTPMLGLATGTQTVSDGATSWAVQGIFGRLHYDYDNKYLIDVSGRYDGSSKFASGHRFALFPSVSAAWYISHEEFMEGFTHILSDLKLRASYGSLGNQNVNSNFVYVPGYSYNPSQSYLIDGSKGLTMTAPGLVSADLTWEKVAQWNVGLDFGLLENRLTGTFDLYTRYTKGMLVNGTTTLPGVLGTIEPRVNAADLKTTGWEIILKWNDRIENIGLDYHASLSLSDAIAEITKYDNISGDIDNYYVGKQIGTIWGYESNGLFQSTQEIAAAPNQSELYNDVWYPGDVRYVDKNGDNEISDGLRTLDDHGDLSVIGNRTPRYQFGLSLGAAWKGFDLEMFFQGVGQRDWVPDGRFFGINSEWDVTVRDMESYWTEENPNGFLPRPYINGGHGNRHTSTRYLQNAAYLRFKQLSLGYTLPTSLTRKISIERVRIYVTGQNLFTWTGLSNMYDPEIIGTAGTDISSVAANMSYPIARTFSFGLNVTF